MGDQPGPAGLVGGTYPSPIVTVEVLVEEQTVVPGGVVLEPLVAAEDRPEAVLVVQEDRDQAVGQVVRDIVEREPAPTAGRVLHGVVLSERAVVAAESPDEQKVDWQPDRASPVGVAAEQVGLRLGRLVADVKGPPAELNVEGMIAVVLR